MNRVLLSCAVAAIAPFARAQIGDPLPTRHLLRVPPGGFVDLDTGVITADREHGQLVADMLFDRDGRGFFVDSWHGVQSCRHDQEAPDEAAWTEERQRVRVGERYTGFSWFVRTDRGAIARITLGVTDPYSSSAAFVQWVVVPPSQAVFLEGPSELRLDWTRQAVKVSWQGDFAEYLVEVRRADEEAADGSASATKTSTTKTRIELRDLAAESVYRVQVRGVTADGVVSLPSAISCLGQRQPSVPGTIDLSGRWFERNGGVSLRDGRVDADHPDLVFYLYGIYAPQGGVVRLGHGPEALYGATELPESDYLPSYGRLDEGDVFALRLADGRYAKLMISAIDGRDQRDGLRVRYAFLAAGGRHFLPRPADAESRFAQGVVELGWQASAGAVRYRITRDDQPERVIDRKSPEARISGLRKNRFYTFRITAVDEYGDASDPLVVEANTFSDGYRLGHFELTPSAAQGYSVTLDRAVARGDGPDPSEDLELAITKSAGGASYLVFLAPYGGALAGDLAFGEFPDADREKAFAPDIVSDSRSEGASTFVFKTKDGKLVSARISDRRYPRIVIDYVLRQ